MDTESEILICIHFLSIYPILALPVAYISQVPVILNSFPFPKNAMIFHPLLGVFFLLVPNLCFILNSYLGHLLLCEIFNGHSKRVTIIVQASALPHRTELYYSTILLYWGDLLTCVSSLLNCKGRDTVSSDFSLCT